MLKHVTIKDDFKINFEKKIISHKDNEKKMYSAKELYSFLMDLFDEPENMRYDIPIMAKPNGEFELINGWRMDKESLKHLKGKLQNSE
jgi:hypothetical protein